MRQRARAAKSPRPDAARSADRSLEVVAWFASFHHRPYSKTAVTSRLPDAEGVSDKGRLVRALAAVDLTSRFVLRDLKSLDPVVLPCLAFGQDGRPVILRKIDRRRGVVLIHDLEDGADREIRRRTLQRALGPEMLLIAPSADPTDARADPLTRSELASARGHWFWAPVRANWAGWLQVLLAALCINILNLALPLFVLNVYDRVIPNLAFVTLWTLGIGVALAILFDMGLRLLRSAVLERISRRVDLRSAAELFRHAMNVRLLERSGGTARIASHIRDFDAVREFFASATFVSMIDLLFIGVFVAVLFSLVGPIAWVPLLAVPAVLILAFIAQLPIGRSVRRGQAVSGKRQAVLVESMLGLETVKSLNAEPVMQREWENAVAASARINGSSRFWSSAATGGTQLIQQAVSVAIIIWGVYLVSEGQITIGGLIAANLLAGRILAPLGTIAQTIFRAQYAIKAMAALSRFMKLPGEQATSVQNDRRVAEARVTVTDLTFQYPEAPTPALKDVSLSVAPGEVVALLGRVGSGKSTLGKLIAGLYVPSDGQILVDGHGAAQYDSSELRAAIGYLPQDPDIFTGTIRENLVLGRPAAPAAELDRALRLSGMAEYVAERPEGLDFFVGEKGQRLSGGQRQGLALARLLLRRPKLLFLDEPTNAMDQDMEARVIAGLRELASERTGQILCTHRPSLAALAERFVVIEAGRKVLDGPKAQVMQQLQNGAARQKAAL